MTERHSLEDKRLQQVAQIQTAPSTRGPRALSLAQSQYAPSIRSCHVAADLGWRWLTALHMHLFIYHSLVKHCVRLVFCILNFQSLFALPALRLITLCILNFFSFIWNFFLVFNTLYLIDITSKCSLYLEFSVSIWNYQSFIPSVLCYHFFRFL